MTERTMTAGEFRGHLRQESLDMIHRHAEAAGRKDHSWRSILQEVKEFFDYDAWDVMTVLAATLYLRPMTMVPESLRQEAAEYQRRQRKAMRRVEDVQAELVSGDDSFFESLVAVERPHPMYHLIQSRGKAADWLKNLFAAHLGVILVETRWPNVSREYPDASPRRKMAEFGESMLSHVGVDNQDDWDLADRYARMKHQKNLPPAPRDEDPEGWVRASALHALEQVASPRRASVLVSPRLQEAARRWLVPHRLPELLLPVISCVSDQMRLIYHLDATDPEIQIQWQFSSFQGDNNPLRRLRMSPP